MNAWELFRTGPRSSRYWQRRRSWWWCRLMRKRARQLRLPYHLVRKMWRRPVDTPWVFKTLAGVNE